VKGGRGVKVEVMVVVHSTVNVDLDLVLEPKGMNDEYHVVSEESQVLQVESCMPFWPLDYVDQVVEVVKVAWNVGY
jgi:hypothetical protein